MFDNEPDAGRDSLAMSRRFVNDGGPLLVLPSRLLQYWRGDFHDDGPHDPFDLIGSDYGRAISAGGLLSELTIGPGHGIVIGAEADATDVRWLTSSDRSVVYFTVPISSDDGDELLLPEVLGVGGNLRWNVIIDNMEVGRDGLSLIHAASSGRESLRIIEPHFALNISDDAIAVMGDIMICPARPGSYIVSYTIIDLQRNSRDIKMAVCRFSLNYAA